MRERGTPHGAGVALYRRWGRPVAKFFSQSAPTGARRLPGGIYDGVAEAPPADGKVYMRSAWLDVYKAVGWPESLEELYGFSALSSTTWIGHTRYPTNSPGWYPYQSHPFSVGDVAIVHNGDLSSYGANVNLLREFGYRDFTGNDSEAIAHLLWELYRRHGVEGAIDELMYGLGERWARLDGPYAVAFIVGAEKPLFGAFVDPQHFRPLYVGLDGRALYVASEAAAIRAVSRRAEVWALRGGEYVLARGGELWGRFQRRAVHVEAPPPPPDHIDASRYGPTELAGAIRRAVEERGRADVVNVLGHRYLASGLERGVVRLWGVVGNASANVMMGGELYIYGDAQEDLGDSMNGGLLAVYGSVGDVVGQAKRGGELYVYGNAGNRAAIQHRGGVTVIGGSAGDYLGEYMGGGAVVVLRSTWDEEVGSKIGSGMVGGTIYIRGEVGRDRIGLGFDWDRWRRYLDMLVSEGELDSEGYSRALKDPHSLGGRAAELFSVTNEVEVRELLEEEAAALSPYIARFNSLFGTSVDIRGEVFTVVRAKRREVTKK